MNDENTNRCRDCRFFIALPDVDGPGIPWCGNVQTKENRNPPIGWLKSDALACEFFADTRTQNESVPDKKHLWLKTEAEDLAKFAVKFALHLLLLIAILLFVLSATWIHRRFDEQYSAIEAPSANQPKH
jgi:hypothetical protein